jgi:hypothetical protein
MSKDESRLFFVYLIEMAGLHAAVTSYHQPFFSPDDHDTYTGVRS